MNVGTGNANVMATNLSVEPALAEDSHAAFGTKRGLPKAGVTGKLPQTRRHRGDLSCPNMFGSYVESLRARIEELEHTQSDAQLADWQQAAGGQLPDTRYTEGGSSGSGISPSGGNGMMEDPEQWQPDPSPSAQLSDAPGSGTVAGNSLGTGPGFVVLGRVSRSGYSEGAEPRHDYRESPRDSGHESPIMIGSDAGDSEQASSETNNDEATVDAMGIVGSLSGPVDWSKAQSSEYFGPSSTFSFVGKTHRKLSKRPGRPSSVGAPDMEDFPRDNPASFPQEPTVLLNESRLNDRYLFEMSLPQRRVADQLVESYWTWTHSLYPLIHRPSFEQRYAMMWSANQLNRPSAPNRPVKKLGLYHNVNSRSFYCLLNALFALGALYLPDMDRAGRERLGRIFFERCKGFLDLDLLASGGLALVQTLLLVGQYLQSTDMSRSCWNIIGLAVRVAQSIGLHQEARGTDMADNVRRVPNQLVVEMRRRTWAGCVMMDR